MVVGLVIALSHISEIFFVDGIIQLFFEYWVIQLFFLADATRIVQLFWRHEAIQLSVGPRLCLCCQAEAICPTNLPQCCF